MRREDQTDLLLSDRFSKVATADVLVARPVIEQLQGSYLAHPRTMTSRRDMQIRAAHFGDVSISTFAFGRAVDITPTGLEDAVVVTTAIRGKAGITIDGNTFDVDAGDTIIAHEEDRPVFMYEPDTEVLKLRFHRSRLEQFFMQAYGRAPRSRLHFDTEMSDAHTAARWVSLLRFLVLTLNGAGAHARTMLELASIEQMLMLTLLNSQPHNYAIARGSAAHGTASTPFERAHDFIHQHLGSDIVLADIAKAAYCSPRTLARAFKDAGEAAPMQYVRKLRLERIRAELLAPASGRKTVAELAFEWGYRHLGEFNRQYRTAFGETPSQTREGAFVALA
ncbi:AraC family transcriptional regulator [Massilia sp. LXY-6]|uniref:helix-turn-helix transcriptional regulator n=1 Tax=Massilia sp. LXY-6 TaxID=3379823 RepID=UPI003EDEC7E6